jgi:phage terminase large subunit
MNVELLPHQWDFLNSQSKYLALIGGIGSGKTFTIAHYLLNRVSKFPKSLHFLGANTYSQLKNSTLDGCFRVYENLGVPYHYNQSTGILNLLNGRILCKSMENFNPLRGIEVGSFVLDEARDMDKEAFDMMCGRLRDQSAKSDLQGRVVTTPMGFNWIYDYFHESSPKRSKYFDMIHVISAKNKHLPDGYLESLKAQYDELFYRQEVLGEFVSLTANRAYYAFDSAVHVKDFEKFNVPFWMFCDFNVDPMTGGAAQWNNGILYIYDEFFLRNSDTYGFCQASKIYHGSRIVPDSTGRARSTTGRSNFDILSQYFNVVYSHNPHIIDRVNNLNRLFREGRIIIHPRCKNLINDLNSVHWGVNGKLDQTKNKLLTHISDGLGYLANYLNPIDTIKRSDIIFE